MTKKEKSSILITYQLLTLYRKRLGDLVVVKYEADLRAGVEHIVVESDKAMDHYAEPIKSKVTVHNSSDIILIIK